MYVCPCSFSFTASSSFRRCTHVENHQVVLFVSLNTRILWVNSKVWASHHLHDEDLPSLKSSAKSQLQMALNQRCTLKSDIYGWQLHQDFPKSSVKLYSITSLPFIRWLIVAPSGLASYCVDVLSMSKDSQCYGKKLLSTVK